MKKLLLPIALAGLMVAGCGVKSDQADEAAVQMTSMRNAPIDSASTPTLASSTTMNRAIIRSASLRLRVDKVDKSEKEANAIIARAGGYVDSVESTDLATPDPKISIRARIPVAAFDVTLERLEALGTRLSKSIKGEDVTEKVVDLDARLKTMTAQEDVYRNMLRQAHELSASTQLQDKLMSLRADIESLTGQRKSLASAAALSTIELVLQQQASPTVMAQSDPSWSSSSWQTAQSSATSALRNLAVFFMWVAAYAPLWIPGLALAWFGRRLLRKQPSRA